MNPIIISMIGFTIILGTTIVLMSSHWFMIWIGFEMNMLAIIPVLMKSHHPRSTEASTKYFLTQTTASMLMLLSVMINLIYTGQWTAMKLANPTASTIMTLSLAMKLGLSPFHFWVPEVTQGIPLTSGLILLTWQKLAPLSVLYIASPNLNMTMLLTMSILSVVMGGWGGLNQTQLRKILAFSSIAHMGWMTAIIMFNPTLTLLNLLLYILMTTTIFMILIFTKSTTTLSISYMWNKTPIMTVIMLTILMSLGGLPPLSGFMPKWMIIQELTKNNNIALALIMAMSALLNLYFYMRLMYATTLTMFPSSNNIKMKWYYTNNLPTKYLPTLTIMSTLLLPLTPMMMMLLN
uniref:NADH-ubiquinone oxidoreductase chain 2 n=1 Tax=Thyroptera tricolor TaxID=124759 RepID=NU2M_THYTR|nr:RecName: Full=NADH-ubiquinone oxidoreductase chain 2; AltName: Full=NADH dehydrogenase subunit 2 [Thyroptera tricolor]AAS91445.1 NADH dehydrogenase subunit 2 [Thyroptera tricolor]